MNEAARFLNDENSRSRSNPTADPGSLQTGHQAILNISQLSSLRKRHTFLNEYSDELIISTPIDTLLKLESTSIKLKNLEKAKDIDDKLTSNRDSLPDTAIQIEQGTDNRWDKLHNSRFLPGMGGSAVKTWLKAREVMGRGGHAPIATYDMGSVGLAGFVTPKGWMEIHDPGSSNLSLRQFSINNCGKRTTTKSGDNMDDEMTDVIEVGEFKCALRVLREAMTFVHPWNKSVAALEGFSDPDKLLLHRSGWFGEAGDNLVAICGLRSAGEFKQMEGAGFMSYYRGSERHLGIIFWRKATVDFGKNEKPGKPQHRWGGGGNTQRQGQFQGVSGQGRVNVPSGFWKDDICVMWNIGKCLKPPGHCFTRGGKQLRHVCNHRPDPARPAVACAANHSAYFYHK